MNPLTETGRRLLTESLAYMRTHGRHRGSYIDSELTMMAVIADEAAAPSACLLGAQIIVASRADWMDYTFDPVNCAIGEAQQPFVEIAEALIAAGAYASDAGEGYADERGVLTHVAMWSDEIESDARVFALIEGVLAADLEVSV